MRPTRTSIAAVAFAVLLGGVGCARRVTSPGAPMAETVIYIAERIHTLDPARPRAEALAVREGKVLATGTAADLASAHEDARVVRLPGATIVPGLADAHGHLAGLGRSLTVVRLKGTRSVAEVVARLKEAGPQSHQGEWLVGRGWDQNDWPEGERRFPDRASLDAAFPDTPVFLSRVDGHAAWVNTEALRRAGVSSGTPDPPGGRILRDEAGAPTGVLVDNAMELVSDRMPELTDEQLRSRLIAALKKAASVGLTSLHDAGMDLRTFTQLQSWDAAGLLPLRVYAMADGQGPDSRLYSDRGTFKGQMLEMRAVKFLMDGALGSRGAALFEPYADDPGNTGLLLLTPEDLEARAVRFMRRGFQVCVHAIGDRANAQVLDVLERAAAAVPENPGRHRLEHAQVLRQQDVERIKTQGLVASMQPAHATSDMPWAEARLGPERVRLAYAWRTLLDAGVPLAFGSDFPVEAPDPLLGLYAARTRQDAQGRPEGGWHPEQRLSAEEALRAFTTGAAFASFSEDERGTLAPGMDADFVALSADPLDPDPRVLLDAEVLLTVVAGKPVHRR